MPINKNDIKEAATPQSGAASENSNKAIIDRELSKIKRRVEDLEDAKSAAIPISPLVPADGLEQVKEKLNFLILYISLGVRYD